MNSVLSGLRWMNFTGVGNITDGRLFECAGPYQVYR